MCIHDDRLFHLVTITYTICMFLTGGSSEQLPAPLFQSTFTSFQPPPAAAAISQDIYGPGSLPAFPVESEGQGESHPR